MSKTNDRLMDLLDALPANGIAPTQDAILYAIIVLAEQVERLADANESMAEGYRRELDLCPKSVVEMVEELAAAKEQTP